MNPDDPIQVAFTQDETTRAGLYDTARVAVVDPGQYDAVYLVGDHGTMWDFPDNEDLQNLVSSIYDKGGVVGAVCHGPAGLVNVELANGFRLVEDRRVAAFTNDEGVAVGKDKVIPFSLADRLEEQGATHVPAKNFTENVVVDERLVTGQYPASAARVAKEMEKLLASTSTRKKPRSMTRPRPCVPRRTPNSTPSTERSGPAATCPARAIKPHGPTRLPLSGWRGFGKPRAGGTMCP